MAKEAYYHSLIYLIMRALRVKVEPEAATSMGRLDLIVSINNMLYIFEFKFDATAREALGQIIEKGYADRYKNCGKKIVFIGASINRAKRMIDDWQVNEVTNACS